MNLHTLWKVIQKKDAGVLSENLAHIGEEESKKLLSSVHKKSGDNCAHLMSRHGKLAMLQMASEHFNLSLELVNLDKKTPLHEAASNRHANIVEYLISKKVAVDPLKHADWTPLMIACTKEKNLDVIKLLVDAGANTNLVNKDGWNCLHIASREGDTKILTYLHKSNPMLCEAASKTQRTPLHTAALHGQTNAVKLLINIFKTNHESPDSCGSTPLMDACRSGNVETMKVLYDLHRSGVFETDKVGKNCLHISAEANKPSSVKFLVTECGMNVNIAVTKASVSQGQTALHLAYKENNSECIELLSCLGASPDIIDARGNKPADMKLVRGVKWLNKLQT